MASFFADLYSKFSITASEQSIDKLLRSMAVNTAGDMAYRIHTEGKRADGSALGEYSKEYMKVRTGLFTTNKTFSKGKNKGKTKPTGVFTKGVNKGNQRPQYNRTSDTKVVASLTRQMENDFGLVGNNDPIKTPNGYGVGFKNQNIRPSVPGAKTITNTDKAGFIEKRYPGTYQLSEPEKKKIRDIAEDFIRNAFQTR
jgi:hypothetical protein